jgi:hypothetical protein
MGGAVAWGLVSHGCAIYTDSLLDPTPRPPVDGAVLEDAAPVDPCTTLGIPERPTNEGSAAEETPFVLAVRRVFIAPDTTRDADARLGINLDRTCTCPGPETCVLRRGAPQHCDEGTGADNALPGVFGQVAGFRGGAPLVDGANRDIAEGEFGILVQVGAYNGAPDDSRVTVSVFLSSGILAPDGGVQPPKDDGTDEWSLDPQSLLGETGPPFVAKAVDENAYVSGGTLVARIDVPILFGGSPSGDAPLFPIETTGGYLVAKLERDGALRAVRGGQIAGRWPTRNLIRTLGKLDVAGAPLCNTPLYNELKTRVCRAADLTADPEADPTTTPCNAVSIALGFDAREARIGPLGRKRIGTEPCANRNDDCE